MGSVWKEGKWEFSIVLGLDLDMKIWRRMGSKFMGEFGNKRSWAPTNREIYGVKFEREEGVCVCNEIICTMLVSLISKNLQQGKV